MRTPRMRQGARSVVALTIGLVVGLAIGPPSSAAQPAVPAAGVGAAASPQRMPVSQAEPAAARRQQAPARPENRSPAARASAPVIHRGPVDTGIRAWQYRPGDPDVVSSAQPSAAQPSVTDAAMRFVGYVRPGGKTVATAVSSATCPGCQGSAFTAAIVMLSGRRLVAADNVAAAWSSCQNCGASAISVQLVFARRATDVVAANRALAVNAACEGCKTTAVALQYVIVGSSRSASSRELEPLLSGLQSGLQASLAAPSGQPAPRSATPSGRAPSIAAAPSTGASPSQAPAVPETAQELQAAVAGPAQTLQERLDSTFGRGTTNLAIQVKTG